MDATHERVAGRAAEVVTLFRARVRHDAETSGKLYEQIVREHSNWLMKELVAISSLDFVPISTVVGMAMLDLRLMNPRR